MPTAPDVLEHHADDRGTSALLTLLLGVTVALIIGVTITAEVFSRLAATQPTSPPSPHFNAAVFLVLLGVILLASMLAAATNRTTNATREPDRLEHLKQQYVEGELSQLEYEARLYDHWEEELLA